MENTISINDASKARINVLDHGFVRLVDSMGSDLSIVRSARVSYDAEWRAGEDEGSDAKLLNYLMRNKHTSPFESVEIQLEVMAPMFIFRQWHRHRTWGYNEQSARYSQLPAMYYLPTADTVGVQSASNKQMREIIQLTPEQREIREAEILELAQHCEHANMLYNKFLTSGWPRELARMSLPVNWYSHMFAKVDLHNLLHFLGLRLHSHAQYEIRVYAEAILELIQPIVPVTIEAWKRHNNIITSKELS